MLYITFYGFYRWDVAGRPPARAGAAAAAGAAAGEKKFGGPQPQPNHRAQLRSHARRDVPRDVPGRPPANRRRSMRSSTKEFGGPQPQRNHRAQLRSHARHVHEDETEIDFPVGVPKGLTPQPPIYTYKTTLRVIRRLWGWGDQRVATSTYTSA